MLHDTQRWLITSTVDGHQWLPTIDLVRQTIFGCILLVALFSLAGILAGMLRRSPGASSLKSVKAWLTLTTAAALWCGLVVNVEAIAWHGKRFRIAAQVEAFERLANQLRDSYPTADGELPYLGPFMAYPFGRPSTLILLQSPSFASHSICVSAVERTSAGAILLQLSGPDGGVWAEWHPPSSRPHSFVGGLGDRHTFSTCESIGNGWYLVRYAANSYAAQQESFSKR